MAAQPFTAASAIAALVISILWGGNVVALKIGLDTFPPFWSAFWRMALGVVGVWAWARWRGISLNPAPGSWRGLCVLALIFVVQISTLNWGVHFTSSAYGVVLLNAHPIWTAILGHFFVAGDRLTGRRSLGMALGFLGVCIVFLGQPDARQATHPILGNLLISLDAFLLASRSVYTQHLARQMGNIPPVFWQIALSLPCFAVLAIVFEPPVVGPITPTAMAAVAYQGWVIATICFLVFTHLLTKHSASLVAMFGFTSPFFGLLGSAVLLDERIPAELIAGIVVVTVGLVLATREKRPRAAAAERPA